MCIVCSVYHLKWWLFPFLLFVVTLLQAKAKMLADLHVLRFFAAAMIECCRSQLHWIFVVAIKHEGVTTKDICDCNGVVSRAISSFDDCHINRILFWAVDIDLLCGLCF